MDYSATIHHLFEQAVLQCPKKTALICHKKHVTYEQLNKKANQLAYYLRDLGLKPDQPVVVCMERSIDFFVASLGILKAGGAYIPLDHTNPEERLLFILNESQAPVVLTTKTLKKSLSGYNGKVVTLDLHELAQQNKENPSPTATSNNLAYIIYTSGSTGTPKGVLIEHKGIVNYVSWFAKECIQGQQELIDCSSNLAFDFALTVTLVPLALGQTVVLCDEQIKKDPRRYLEHLQSHAITLIKITPSYFRVLFNELEHQKISFPHLRKIMLAGENVPTVDCQQWLNKYPKHRLFNEYGPTETSVAVTLYEANRNTISQCSETIPIGYLVPNANFLLLNQNQQPVSQGEIGELYLGGICLARGYLNNPKLTDYYFITPPNSNGKLYKTGDLCRLLPSGALECIGRIDHQLKIRGFRVELEEIEQCLLKHSAIKNAVVIASNRVTKEKRLIAYYIVNAEAKPIDPKVLRKHLVRFLPEYMIPSSFVEMEQFPLNANEKLDRTALPEPPLTSSQHYVAPKSPLEKKLAAIWAKELGVVAVGLEDNFFELGGHSLSAARIISQTNHQFSKDLSIQSIYQAQILKTHAALVRRAKKITSDPFNTPLPNAYKALPLSDFQLMLWLADTFEPKAKKLNIYARKRLQGRIDLANLNNAFALLLQKHKILSYRVSKFQPHHYLQEYTNHQITEYSLAHLSAEESEYLLNESCLELKQYHPWPKHRPQIIIRLFHLNNDYSEVQLCLPHLIADDLCPDILLTDLSTYYQQKNNESHTPPSSYKEYIANEQYYFKKHLIEDTEFWEKHFHDTQLFSFSSRHIVTNMNAKGIPYSSYARLGEETLHHFKQYCAKHHITILDGLCATLMLALCQTEEYIEQNYRPICINRVKSTRDNLEYDNTVGCFLRLEPIKLLLTNKVCLDSLALAIHEEVVHTAPYQRCSNLIKLASLGAFRKEHNIIKQKSIRFALKAYNALLRLKINYTILNMAGRLSSAKGNQFLINVNMHNNFLNASKDKHKQSILGCQVQPIAEQFSDLLQIDNLVDICFLRMENQEPYIALSANLTPDFKQQIMHQMIQIMEQTKKVELLDG